MDIINLDPAKKIYGLIVDNKIFLASLCELPNIIEGQKTLDFRTFYKSVDVSQILYIHNKVIEDYQQKSPEELVKIAKDYNPVLEDPDFLNSLYRKSETKRMVEEQKVREVEVKYDILKFRHGLAPVAKNIRNIRHKKEPNEDPDEVHAVEQILKDIIDYGFADNVEEELLEFDDNGDLKSCVKGAKEKRKEQVNNNLIQIDYLLDPSARSESNYQGQFQFAADGQSSMYSVPVDQFDDGTSYRQDTVYNENQGQDQEQSQTYPQIQIQRNQSSAPLNQSESYQQNQFNQPNMSGQANFSASQFLNQSHQNMPSSYNQTPTFDQINQQFQAQQFQQDDVNMSYQQNQQTLSSSTSQQITQFDTSQPQAFQQSQIPTNEPIYTYQDYIQMKQDLKELKKLIKTTKSDIQESQQQGVDITELKSYYRQLCQHKDEIKSQKKIAKRQLKRLQQQQQAMQQ
eukprot:403368367